MTTPTEINLDCPCCGKAFEATTWGSTNLLGPQTTDFYQQSSGWPPLLMEIFTCPVCGYSGLYGDFVDVTVDEPVVDLIRRKITPLLDEEEPSAARRYEFAAWIAAWRGDNPKRVGDLYLKAAWCCYEGGHDDLEMQYRRQAILHFEEAFQKGMIPADEVPTHTYLIGELYRRIGEREKGALWFDQVPEVVDDDADMQWLVDLAYQQKTAPEEFMQR